MFKKVQEYISAHKRYAAITSVVVLAAASVAIVGLSKSANS